MWFKQRKIANRPERLQLGIIPERPNNTDIVISLPTCQDQLKNTKVTNNQSQARW